MNAADLIEKLQLKPHPEGGWFREIHRATEKVTTERGTRSAMTTIYYLLERAQLSRWHVVQSDEIWHFYSGAPLELIVYDPATHVCKPTLLDAPVQGREPVGIVRAGEWQAARTLGDYSLVGCNVGPGFEFADFQFVAALPGHADHFTGDLARFRTLL